MEDESNVRRFTMKVDYVRKDVRKERRVRREEGGGGGGKCESR